MLLPDGWELWIDLSPDIQACCRTYYVLGAVRQWERPTASNSSPVPRAAAAAAEEQRQRVARGDTGAAPSIPPSDASLAGETGGR